MRLLLSSMLTSIALLLSACGSDDNTTTASASQCGDVQIAEMTWASAQLVANIDKLILKEGYDCNASLIAGDTNPTFASMSSKGVPDIAPEMWINSVRNPLEKAISEGTLHIANMGPITELGEGWWIDANTAKNHPEIKTVADVLARPDLFPYKEDATKGAFHTCPAGWACQVINGNLFKGFDMEAKGWTMVNPGSGAGLDGSIAKSAETGTAWFGYYWAPTAIIGKYNLVQLDYGVPYIGDEHWNACTSKVDCDAPKATAWTESAVRTIVTDSFKQGVSADVSDYLAKRVLPGSVVNALLVHMNENKASGEDAAYKFLTEHRDVWTAWVNEAVATKITNAIK